MGMAMARDAANVTVNINITDPPKDSKRGVAWTEKTLIIASNTGAIDVYIKATNKDGEIEVML